MTNKIKQFIDSKGLKIIWLAREIGMKPKTLYRKIEGSRSFRSEELDQINAVLGTSFEAKGEKNDRS